MNLLSTTAITRVPGFFPPIDLSPTGFALLVQAEAIHDALQSFWVKPFKGEVATHDNTPAWFMNIVDRMTAAEE